jgi:mono/diheme cytochrome c family protein
MMFKKIHLSAFIVMLLPVALAGPRLVHAQDRSGVLQGVVKDASGAPVAGAFVKMKNSERRLTFMVISQAQGRFAVNTLPAGKYVAQGIGGDYQSEPSASVEVAAGKPATVDLSLTVARAPQLAPAWPGRLPGEQGGEADQARGARPSLPGGAGKQIVETKCVACHDAQRTLRTRANRDRWHQIIQNMRAYAQGSTLAKDLTDQEEKILLDYVATNFSGSRSGSERPKPDPNSRLPRALLQGEATKYMAVEYELPNLNAEPHEVTVDAEGNGWVTQRIGGKLGRLDPKTFSVPSGDG